MATGNFRPCADATAETIASAQHEAQPMPCQANAKPMPCSLTRQPQRRCSKGPLPCRPRRTSSTSGMPIFFLSASTSAAYFLMAASSPVSGRLMLCRAPGAMDGEHGEQARAAEAWVKQAHAAQGQPAAATQHNTAMPLPCKAWLQGSAIPSNARVVPRPPHLQALHQLLVLLLRLAERGQHLILCRQRKHTTHAAS